MVRLDPYAVTYALTCTSKHILNAQVAIRSPCCRRWFDCADCHAETESHPLQQSLELVFACKKCKKCFRKDAQEFEDRYVPVPRPDIVYGALPV